MVLGAGVVLLVAALLALDRMALLMMRAPRRPPARSPRDVGLEAETWQIAEADGDPALNGWWIPGGDPQGPVVVLCHGWGANTGVVLPLAPVLQPLASAVVAFDVRGHGRSDDAARASLRQFRDDALRVIQATLSRSGGQPLVMVGHSMGGAAAILAAAEGAPVHALALVATPYDVYHAIGTYLDDQGLPGSLTVALLKPFWRLRVGLPYRVLHPGRRLAGLDLPVVVIQPENDTRVVPAEGRRLARSAGVEPLIVPGAAHTDVLERGDVHEALRTFAAAMGCRS